MRLSPLRQRDARIWFPVAIEVDEVDHGWGHLLTVVTKLLSTLHGCLESGSDGVEEELEEEMEGVL